MLARLSIIGGFVCLFCAGCSNTEPQSTVLVGNGSPFGVRLMPFEVPQTGKLSELRIQALLNGKPFDLASKGIMMHLIVSDLQGKDLAHVNSLIPVGENMYEYTQAFLSSGTHRLWIELTDTTLEAHHGEKSLWLGYWDFSVSGNVVDVTTVQRELEYTDDGITLQLRTRNLKVNELSSIAVAVFDESGTRVALDAENETMYAFVGDNLRFYQHGHIQSAHGEDAITFTPTAPGKYILWMRVLPLLEGRRIVLERKFVLSVL